MKFKCWYLTKKDGNNWINAQEMNNANIEDLNIYQNLEDIPSEYVCIGIYFESINGHIVPQWNSNHVRLKIKETANIGQTYGIVHRAKLWTETLDRSIYTIENKDVQWPTPEYDSGNRNYIKTEYNQNGEMMTGTHYTSYADGNTMLIVGGKLGINKTPIDDNGKLKTNYDFSKNEYDVKYKLAPVIENDSYNDVKIEGVTLKIEDTLPKEMSYVPESTNSHYNEPEIIKNSDGTTTLLWYIYDASSNQLIEPITYKAHINETTENGILIQNTAIVSEVPHIDEYGNRTYKVGNSLVKNRTATASIEVINLASYTLNKITDTEIIEKNGEIHFKITYKNNTNTKVSDFAILDIMPYNSDSRGTKYTGIYTIDRIEITQKDKDKNIVQNDNLRVYKSQDEKIINVSVKDKDLGTNSIWSEVSNENGIYNMKLIQENNGKTGIGIKGIVGEQAEVVVDIYIKTDGNNPNDIYINSASAQTQSTTEEMTSSQVQVHVIQREIEGRVWYDKNYNGIIDDGEGITDDLIDNVRIKLFKLDSEGNLEETRDIYGNIISEIQVNEQGFYKFNDLEKGEYKVQITYNGEKYWLTKKEIGADTRINSKFNSEEIGKGITDKITKLNSNVNSKISQSYVNAGLSTGNFNIGVDKSIKQITVNGEDYYVVEKNKKVNIGLDKKDENGNEKYNEVKIKYNIIVRNTEDVPGIVKIEENIPISECMEYIKEESNNEWRQEENKLILETNLLAGESKEYEVVLRWKGTSNEFGKFKNVVNIQNENAVGKEESNIDDNTDEVEVKITSKLILPLTGGKGIFISITIGMIITIIGLILIKKK